MCAILLNLFYIVHVSVLANDRKEKYVTLISLRKMGLTAYLVFAVHGTCSLHSMTDLSLTVFATANIRSMRSRAIQLTSQLPTVCVLLYAQHLH